MAKKNKKKKEQKEQKEQIVIINNIQSSATDPRDYRTLNIYGDITEERASEVVSSLIFLEKNCLIETQKEDSEELVVQSLPINIYLSTHGGSAAEMFAIIDTMDAIKGRSCDIETIGIGKVMSAGVPILAAGTKGLRKISKNCRVMIHNLTSMTGGSIERMENDIQEMQWNQDRYIECLSKYTKLTKAKIKKILKSQKDVYISAEEAIKYGIADEIF